MVSNNPTNKQNKQTKVNLDGGKSRRQKRPHQVGICVEADQGGEHHWILWANGTSRVQWWDSHTLQGINISHLGKRKIIFKSDFWWDMLVPWRVIPIAKLQKFTPYVVETTMSVFVFWSLKVYKDGKLDNLTYNHPLIWFGCVAIFFTGPISTAFSTFFVSPYWAPGNSWPPPSTTSGCHSSPSPQGPGHDHWPQDPQDPRGQDPQKMMRKTAGTYSHHPFFVRNILFTKPPGNYVPCFHLPGCILTRIISTFRNLSLKTNKCPLKKEAVP